MTVEQELERFYGDLRPDPDAERRVIAAVTATSTRAPRWRPVLVVALSAAAVVLAAVLVAVLRPDGRSRSQRDAVHPGPVSTMAFVPAARTNTVVGAVTDNGRPVRGARVSVQIWPSPAGEQPSNGNGPGGPVLRAGNATTGADGGFTITIPAFTPAYLNVGVGQNRFLNVMYGLVLPDRRQTVVSGPIDVQNGRTVPMTMIFDVGRSTFTMNGDKGDLSGLGGASETSYKPPPPIPH